MTSASPATVFLGICAILFGLASAYGVRVAMNQKEVPAPVAPAPVKVKPQERTKPIVVAKVNLPPYARISAENLQVFQIPENKFYEGAITRAEVLIGRVTKRAVTAGNAMSEADVFEFGKVPTVEEKLHEGETAMTIPVDTSNSVAGLIQPESRVNISLTVTGEKHPDLKELTTVTLFKNVRVLATSETTFPENPNLLKRISNVTVAVTQSVANKLLVAQKYGMLGVTLARGDVDPNTGAQDVGPEEAVSPLDLFGLDEVTPLKDSQPVLACADQWNGTNRRTIKFTEDEVLESVNATRVNDRLPVLKKLPRKEEE